MLLSAGVNAQEDSIPAKELVILKYFNNNNRVQYLILENFVKTGRKTEPLKDKVFNIYIDSINTGNLIATVTTDVKGKAKSDVNLRPDSWPLPYAGRSVFRRIHQPMKR